MPKAVDGVPIATDVAEALRLWHRVQAVLRITTSEGMDNESGPKSPREALSRATGCTDFAAAQAHMDAVASRVHAHFNALIAQPAEDARQRLDARTQTGD